MKLMIYDKDGRQIKKFKNVKAHSLKTIYLGSPLRHVLMFQHGFGDGSIDIVNGMTFALYNGDKQ